MPKTIIIAEAGVNHNGDMDLAKELIISAKGTGADYVKFQSFITEENISTKAPKADYQLETTSGAESQFEMLKALELSIEDTKELKSFADEHHIGFMTTPAERENVRLVLDLGLDFIKVASESITNYLLLSDVASCDMPTILSTGMCTLEEIKAAIEILEKSGLKKSKLTLLHCNSEYPSPFEDLNLRSIITMREELNVPVGFSDHSVGDTAAIIAVAFGATIIEKHFTLDNNLPGPDHSSSLNPDDFSSMVKKIRNAEDSLGDGVKRPSPSEEKNISFMRRSLVAKKAILQGDIFSRDNVAAKRPGTGCSPMLWETLEGKRAKKDYQLDQQIEP